MTKLNVNTLNIQKRQRLSDWIIKAKLYTVYSRGTFNIKRQR